MVEVSTRSDPAGELPREIEMYRDMVRARVLSDRMFALNRQGRAQFAVTGQGREAAQVGSAYAIRRGYDWVLPYYPSHAGLGGAGARWTPVARPSRT